MLKRVFPDQSWLRIDPELVNLDSKKLQEVAHWLETHAVNGYRLAVIRHGYVAFDQYAGIDPMAHLSIASAAKSVYGNVLGIMVDQGTLPSADARVVDFYPEMMDVPEGTGPKAGRYAYRKDRDITFRQLICNVSGYMKPGELPGTVFNYQTYGMNVLTHALAKLQNLYDVNDPERLPGFAQLITDNVANKIGANWTYDYANFKLPSEARINIFGYYTRICTTALDLARVGWLWCNYGRWEDEPVIPELWMRQQVQVAPDILANCPEHEWMYGHGIWTNAAGQLWLDLPRDGFTSSGAGGHYVSVFPSLDLVIVQNPGVYSKTTGSERANPRVLKAIIDALLD